MDERVQLHDGRAFYSIRARKANVPRALANLGEGNKIVKKNDYHGAIGAIVKKAQIVSQGSFDYGVYTTKLAHANEVLAKLPGFTAELKDRLGEAVMSTIFNG